MDLVELVVLVAAFTASLAALAKFGPLRWVWEQLVHKPVRESLDIAILEGVLPHLEALQAEMALNGGTTLRDAIARLELLGARLEAQIASVAAGVDEAKSTAASVRHELEMSVLASQSRLPASTIPPPPAVPPAD